MKSQMLISTKLAYATASVGKHRVYHLGKNFWNCLASDVVGRISKTKFLNVADNIQTRELFLIWISTTHILSTA